MDIDACQCDKLIKTLFLSDWVFCVINNRYEKLCHIIESIAEPTKTNDKLTIYHDKRVNVLLVLLSMRQLLRSNYTYKK